MAKDVSQTGPLLVPHVVARLIERVMVEESRKDKADNLLVM